MTEGSPVRSVCRTSTVAFVLGVSLPLAPVPPASAGVTDIDLLSARTRLLGAGAVGGAGDVNGDARPDLLVANAMADPFGRKDAGAAFIRTGGRRKAAVSGPDFAGFRIAGAGRSDRLRSTCIAGDVNGDELADALVGAQTADTPNGEASGAAYVVFGSKEPDDVDLRSFHRGTQGGTGFRIDGPGTFTLAGLDVACIGDVNLDGLADLAVAAPFAGATYVVFGKATSDPVDLRLFELNAHGTTGFRIATPSPENSGDYAVGAAGDVDRDGHPDVIIGVIAQDFDSPGTGYVVFGKADPLPVDVTEGGNEWGYRIEGESDGFATGSAVAGAGDVNGDGFDDVVLGAHRIYRNLPGRAYVVYGNEAPVDVHLGDLGDGGFPMTGGPGRDAAGSAVAPAGDFDADGFEDVLVGAPWGSGRRRVGAGVVYVVYGAVSSPHLRLRELGHRGHRIIGARPDDQMGSSVRAFDSNGRSRVMIGSWYSERVYVMRVAGR